MRFLVDAQLPAELSWLLARHGHQSEHVMDVGLDHKKDNVLWEYAERAHAIIVTKDEDFADWVGRGKPGPSVVWLRIGNCTNARLLSWFDALFPQVFWRLSLGERLVEVR